MYTPNNFLNQNMHLRILVPQNIFGNRPRDSGSEYLFVSSTMSQNSVIIVLIIVIVAITTNKTQLRY